ncbi:MAG: MFS transporter [Lachnospiraceae bacterium]|nr:MFS transporter [Lachnospiraceae bacterium]
MKKYKKNYLLIAIIIVGICLRPSITGIGSLMKLIKPDLMLSDTACGMLTTIPLLTFAVISPMVKACNTRIGTGRTLIMGFLLIAFGTLIRSFCGLSGLYLGTVLIGSGIACGNVLMPAIIKNEFAEKYGFVTALNCVGLAVSSAIASGVNYPLADNIGLGWQFTLCIYAAVSIVAIAVWFPVRAVSINTRKVEGNYFDIMKDKTAWAVTLFLGIEALAFYSCSAWLSTIFQSKGLDAVTAGYYVSCFQLTGIPASFLMPALAGRYKDQRKLTCCVVGAFLMGIVMMACTEAPSVLFLAALIGGFGCNGGFALSMAFIGFRTDNGTDAMLLSGMSQSIGYVIAAFGPTGLGIVHDWLGDWNASLWIVAALLVILLAVGMQSAKDKTIDTCI